MHRNDNDRVAVRPRHDFRALNPDDDYRIKNFMVAPEGLGLTGVRLLVYALVYSFSYDPDAAGFFGSADYISTRTGASSASVKDALKWLQEQNLIAANGTRRSRRGKPVKVYAIVDSEAEKARESFRAAWSDPTFARQVETAPTTIYCGGKLESNNGQKLAIIVENSPSDPPKWPETGHYDPRKWPEIGHNKKDIYTQSNPSVHPSDSTGPQSETTTTAPNHKTDHGRTDGWTENVDEAFRALDRISVNRNLLNSPADRHAAKASLDALIADGFEPALILSAWEERQKACSGREARFHPQLKKWIESDAPDGARALCARLSAKGDNSHANPAPKSRGELVRRAYAVDKKFADAMDEWDALRRRYEERGAGDPEALAEAERRVVERFDLLREEGVI